MATKPKQIRQHPQLLAARKKLAEDIKATRLHLGLTQRELAKRLKTTQPRVARIERAASDVSLDTLFKAFVALGGSIAIDIGGK